MKKNNYFTSMKVILGVLLAFLALYPPFIQSRSSKKGVRILQPCDAKQFWNEQTQACEACKSPCENCTTTPTTCTSCPTGSYLANSNCYPCNEPCKTCYWGDNKERCITCTGGLYGYNGGCVADCPSNSIRNTGNYTCTPCMTGCRVCSKPETCDECYNEGYYTLNSVCYACSPNCKICAAPGGQFDCTTCQIGYFLDPPAKGECKICDGSCKTCVDSSKSKCTSCIGTQVIELVPNQNYGSCMSECNLGYFNSSGVCTLCHSTCRTCQGTKSTDCVTCQMPMFLKDGACISDCGFKFFNNGGQCTKCTRNCMNCTGESPHECFVSQCNATNNKVWYEENCVDVCPEVFYNDSFICTPCYHACKHCKNEDFFSCINCVATLYLKETINGGYECVSECGIGFFLDGPNGPNCTKCHPLCQNCAGSLETNCVSCDLPRVLFETRCVMECPQGYFRREFKCVKCHPACLNCSEDTENNCMACENGRFLKLIPGTVLQAATCAQLPDKISDILKNLDFKDFIQNTSLIRELGYKIETIINTSFASVDIAQSSKDLSNFFDKYLDYADNPSNTGSYKVQLLAESPDLLRTLCRTKEIAPKANVANYTERCAKLLANRKADEFIDKGQVAALFPILLYASKNSQLSLNETMRTGISKSYTQMKKANWALSQVVNTAELNVSPDMKMRVQKAATPPAGQPFSVGETMTQAKINVTVSGVILNYVETVELTAAMASSLLIKQPPYPFKGNVIELNPLGNNFDSVNLGTMANANISVTISFQLTPTAGKLPKCMDINMNTGVDNPSWSFVSEPIEIKPDPVTGKTSVTCIISHFSYYGITEVDQTTTSNLGLIIGIIAGVVVLVAAVILIIWFLKKRKEGATDTSDAGDSKVKMELKVMAKT